MRSRANKDVAFPVRTGRSGVRGYTLIELVTVMVVLGVLASVAGTRFFSQQPFSERGYADELAAALRFAQKVAVSSGCPARLTLASTSYSVAQQAASGNTCNSADTTWSIMVSGPDGATLAGSAPSGTTASPTGQYMFDAQGRLASAPATTLAIGSRSINVDAATGFIEGP